MLMGNLCSSADSSVHCCSKSSLVQGNAVTMHGTHPWVRGISLPVLMHIYEAVHTLLQSRTLLSDEPADESPCGHNAQDTPMGERHVPATANAFL